MAGAANVLPDPAIRSCASTPRGKHESVTPLERIQAHARAHATREGRISSVHPDVHYFRADRPFGPKPVSTGGVVMAVVAEREKVLELSDGQRLRYAPGEYLFFTREARYTSFIERATPARPYISVGLTIDPDVIAQTVLAIDDVREREPGADTDAWAERMDDALAESFCRLLDSLADPVERRVLTPLIVREIVFRLLLSEHAGPLRRAVRADDPRIRDAMQFAREHAADALTVEDLAKRVAMSPSHFAHRFREIARMSPMRFVKNVRLGQARLRMVRDGLGASEAALAVGYASPSHFTRDFKSQYGATPAAYARELRARLTG